MIEDEKHYVGNIGTVILVDVKSDINTATVLLLKVRKPDGTAVNWTGTLYDNTKIKYIVKEGDWNIPGTYKLQSYVVMPGWAGRGKLATFKIEKEFE